MSRPPTETVLSLATTQGYLNERMRLRSRPAGERYEECEWVGLEEKWEVDPVVWTKNSLA
jgi:hypothetical protein